MRGFLYSAKLIEQTLYLLFVEFAHTPNHISDPIRMSNIEESLEDR